jgi:hypothetical protein
MIAALSIFCGFVIAMLASRFVRGRYPCFRDFWDAEGAPICMMAAFGIAIIFLSARGCDLTR